MHTFSGTSQVYSSHVIGVMVNVEKQRGPTVAQLPERTDRAAVFAATVFTRPEKARRGKGKL